MKLLLLLTLILLTGCEPPTQSGEARPQPGGGDDLYPQVYVVTLKWFEEAQASCGERQKLCSGSLEVSYEELLEIRSLYSACQQINLDTLQEQVIDCRHSHSGYESTVVCSGEQYGQNYYFDSVPETSGCRWEYEL